MIILKNSDIIKELCISLEHFLDGILFVSVGEWIHTVNRIVENSLVIYDDDEILNEKYLKHQVYLNMVEKFIVIKYSNQDFKSFNEYENWYLDEVDIEINIPFIMSENEKYIEIDKEKDIAIKIK